MKIYIVLPDCYTYREKKPFSLVFSDVYAERVIKHLEDNPDLCTGCGKKCVSCRNSYSLNFSSNIAGIHKLPPELLYYIDNPNDFLPAKLPHHDVMLAINVHEDILLALPSLAKKAGAKAIIAPIEDPDWLTSWGRKRMHQICNQHDLEFISPKPFCSLESGGHPFIDKFIEHFRIGKPKLEIKSSEGIIKKVKVLRSAPCGVTYFVAHNLLGKKIDDKLREFLSKYWHSFPCVASMKMDDELGDTILHRGGHININTFKEAVMANDKIAGLKI